MLVEKGGFEVFDCLDAGVFNCLTHQNLQHWLHLPFKIEQIVITVKYLSEFLVPFFVWDVGGIGSPVDEVVRLDFRLVDHVLVVFQVLPLVSRLVGVHLMLLLFIYHLIVSHLLLLSPLPQFLPPLSLEGLFYLLLLNERWIWLHVDGDDERSKGVSSNNPPVVHDVLGSNLAADG